MSDAYGGKLRTFGRKKTAASSFSNPSLVSPTTPTLANPTRGFGLPTNNVIQTATEVSTELQEVESADERSLEQQTSKEKPITHDISRISLRCPQAKLTVGEPGDKYEQEADMMANRVMSMPATTVQRQILPEEVQTIPVVQQKSEASESIIQRLAFGNNLSFNSLHGSPPRVELYGPYSDQAIAQELYGNSSIAIHHDPEDHTIVTVLRDRLLAHWRPYFPEERFPEGDSHGESIEHEPSHRDEPIATWVGWPEAEISTTSVVGEQPIASYLPFSAIPHSLVTEGWTPGHYVSEAAAIAAIRAAGTAGAVFLEQGRYVAYHTRDDAWVFNFTWENIRWEQGKPWTKVRFDTRATAIVTNDGAVIRADNYKTEEEAETQTADQALMPGSEEPFTGYQEAFGDFNTLSETTFFVLFQGAMKDNALSMLQHSRRAAEREVERRSSCGLIPPEEIERMRNTASYLAGIDQEMEDIPKTLPPDPEHHRRFWALKRRRSEVLARYPRLARIEPREFVRLSETEQNQALGQEALEVLEDIETTRENILDGSLNLWAIRSIVDSTIAGLGITDPDRRKMVLDWMQAERNADTAVDIAITVFSIGFGLAAAFTTGPVGLAFAAGAFGLETADAIRQTDEWYTQSAAANTALAPDESLFNPEKVGSFGWVVAAWIGVGFDAADVIRAVGAIHRAGGVIEEGVQALARKPSDVPRLRMAAGEIATGEKITSATLPVVSRRLGAEVEINDTLGTAIEVHYYVNSRGRIIVERVLCGSDAVVTEILAHAGVVRLLRRYDGLTGRIRALIDRLRSLVTGRVPPGVNPFPPGSQAFESWLELEKLPGIIEARRAALGNVLGTEAEPLLRRDVEFLESELAHHQRTVDQMVLEEGSGFVARAQEQTELAMRPISEGGAGMPRLDQSDLISDPSQYYYRRNPNGQPPYHLVRLADSSAPARTIVPNAEGGWEIAEGALSRSEQADALVRGWPSQVQTGYQALTAEFPDAFRVVPLQGVATTGRKIADLDPELAGNLHEILFEAYTRAGDPDPFGQATSAVAAVTQHEITVVRGTNQLRSFNYRLNFANETGQAASGDLHHMIPLYLGGDNRHLVDVHKDLHDRLHDLIDAIPFEEGTTLAPHSIQRSSSLNFSEGAAVLNNDGTVQLFRLNPDGSYMPVP